MTYNGALTARPMENHPWQQRARAAGLSQRTLSRLLGRPDITISKQLRGHWGDGRPPKHLVAAILAWEIMAPEMRQRWIEAAEEYDAPPENKSDAQI